TLSAPALEWGAARAAAAAGRPPLPDERASREKPVDAAPSPVKTGALHEAVVRLLRAAARRAALAQTARPGRPEPASGSPRSRALLATAPAAPASGGRTAAVSAFSRSAAGAPAGASWSRRSARSFPLFTPPRRAGLASKAERAAAAARRRARPLLLSKLLGPGALRPPPSALTPPDLAGLDRRKPARLPDGSPVPSRPYELDRLEAHDPRRSRVADRRVKPHWDPGDRWHDGPATGVAADARWLWLWKEKTRVWAVGEPGLSPLLRHRELWWGKQKGVWFALHDGQLWNWRRFSDWDAEGLIRLTDGVELVYSADFTKVAVITPGAGAVLYDARTGAELGHWLEHELPARRPAAPDGLRLPRGI
ncbi:MAG: hypothetical protein Q8T11_17580, partial [Elusimicrobiota bacterium]|nr:hypothetical protein [Elusimicrobiota bacterium]